MKAGAPAGATAAMSHHRAPGSQTSARDREERPQASGSYFYFRPSFAPKSRRLCALLPFLVLLVTWSSLLGVAAGQELGSQRSAGTLDDTWMRSSLLHLDTRPAPLPPFMPGELLRRNDGEKTSATSTAAPSKASLATDPKATETGFSIPKAFDTALSNNFTANCAAFYRSFLTNDAFTLCHPFSLLIQTSSSFFDASKSFVRITQTLEATCNVDFQICLNNMDHLARELILEKNCGIDYSNDNPQVLQAYNGLLAYEPLYQASCLRDDDGNFCYATAVTDRDNPPSAYPYYLPLGQTMPGGGRPTCNTCLQNVMAIFSSFAGNATQPISKTYNGAAQQISIACGTNFVNQTATPLKGAAATASVSFAPTLSLLLMLFLYLFQ